jgi:hypothetical protein
LFVIVFCCFEGKLGKFKCRRFHAETTSFRNLLRLSLEPLVIASADSCGTISAKPVKQASGATHWAAAGQHTRLNYS